MRPFTCVLPIALALSLTPLFCMSQGKAPQTPESCNTSSIIDTQLPLQPHETAFKWAPSLGSHRGSWQRQNKDGTWPPLPSESTKGDLWATGSKSCGDCVCATLDFGNLFGLCEPGEYKFRFITTDGQVWIGPITITLEKPQGIDSEAYEKLLLPRLDGRGHPFEQNSLLYGDRELPGKPPIGKRLLEEYPTSVYAAYVLVARVPDVSNWRIKIRPPADQVRAARDEGKAVVPFPDKNFETYFKQLETFIKAGNVPPQMRARLCGYYGELLVSRGCFMEAESSFRQALTDPSQDAMSTAYRARAADFLKCLESR